MRAPPEGLRVDTAPDAYRLELQTLPSIGHFVRFVLTMVLCFAVLIGPSLIPLPSAESVPMPELMDFEHLQWHACEDAEGWGTSLERMQTCEDYAPFVAQHDQVDRQERYLIFKVGMDADEARAAVRQHSRAAWQEQHRRAIAVYGHEHMLWWDRTQRDFTAMTQIAQARARQQTTPVRALAYLDPAVVPLRLLALLGMLVLGVRFVLGFRPLELVLTPESLRWGDRTIRRGEVFSSTRHKRGLALVLVDGTLLHSGQTTHDVESLDWLAETIGLMKATDHERAEEEALSAEVRSHHAAMAGRVKA